MKVLDTLIAIFVLSFALSVLLPSTVCAHPAAPAVMDESDDRADRGPAPGNAVPGHQSSKVLSRPRAPLIDSRSVMGSKGPATGVIRAQTITLPVAPAVPVRKTSGASLRRRSLETASAALTEDMSLGSVMNSAQRRMRVQSLTTATCMSRIAALAGKPTDVVTFLAANTDCCDEFLASFVSTPASFYSSFWAVVSDNRVTSCLFASVSTALETSNSLGLNATYVTRLLADYPGVLSAASRSGVDTSDWQSFFDDNTFWDLFGCPAAPSALSNAQLLESLLYSGESCTDTLASALGDRPAASRDVDVLIANGKNVALEGWSRRNAVRAIGILCVNTSRSSQLVVKTRRTDVISLLDNRVRNEDDEDTLDEAIAVLTRFFLPYLPLLPRLQQLVFSDAFTELLHARAAGSAAVLLKSKPYLEAADITYLLKGINWDEDSVRPLVASGCVDLVLSRKLNGTSYTRVRSAIEAQFASDECFPCSVWMARTLDGFDGRTTKFDSVLSTFLATFLSTTFRQSEITIRTGINDTARLSCLATTMYRQRMAFVDVLGPAFAEPVGNDTNANITLVVFADPDAYSNYMSAFVGYGDTADGVYVESQGLLYTYDRRSTDSELNLNEVVLREYGRYLHGRYVWPGILGAPGYYKEPLGWADLGYGEYWASLNFDNAGRYRSTLRKAFFADNCPVTASAMSLTTLLALRTGYDSGDGFDIFGACTFATYMATYRADATRRIFSSFRRGNYSLSTIANITGVSVAVMQSEWRAAVTSWCGNSSVFDNAPFKAPASGVDAFATCSLIEHGFPTDDTVYDSGATLFGVAFSPSDPDNCRAQTVCALCKVAGGGGKCTWDAGHCIPLLNEACPAPPPNSALNTPSRANVPGAPNANDGNPSTFLYSTSPLWWEGDLLGVFFIETIVVSWRFPPTKFSISITDIATGAPIIVRFQVQPNAPFMSNATCKLDVPLASRFVRVDLLEGFYELAEVSVFVRIPTGDASTVSPGTVTRPTSTPISVALNSVASADVTLPTAQSQPASAPPPPSTVTLTTGAPFVSSGASQPSTPGIPLSSSFSGAASRPASQSVSVSSLTSGSASARPQTSSPSTFVVAPQPTSSPLAVRTSTLETSRGAAPTTAPSASQQRASSPAGASGSTLQPTASSAIPASTSRSTSTSTQPKSSSLGKVNSSSSSGPKASSSRAV